MKRIPLYDLTVSGEARRQVNEVMASGWLTTGPKAREFETAAGRSLHVRNVVGVSSATAGLQLALESLGVAGREVITTPLTFVATVEAILRAGAQPVLADIVPETLCVDPDEVHRKKTIKTGCVLPVDIAGHLADYSRLSELCNAAKIPLLADASHAFGATLQRKSTAQWTDCAVYSCHATKNVTTGEGGLVATRHKVLADQIRLLSRHAMTTNAYERQRLERWEYDVTDLGLKSNLSDLHAALGLGQLAVLKSNQTKREAVARRYHRNLADLQELLHLPGPRPGYVHSWHLYIVRLHLSRLRIGRNRLIRLMSDAGIECSVHYKPLYDMSYYRAFGFRPDHFPNTTYVSRRVVSLPMYPGLKLADVDRVCDALRDLLCANKR